VLPCVAVCCSVLQCVAVVLYIYSYLIEVAGEAAEEVFRIDAGLPEKSAVVYVIVCVTLRWWSV